MPMLICHALVMTIALFVPVAATAADVSTSIRAAQIDPSSVHARPGAVHNPEWQYDEVVKAFKAHRYVQAAFLAKLSADDGHAQAAAMLGDLFHEGKGVKKDDRQAVEWWRKAADAGNDDEVLAYKLYRAYETGRGVGKDQHEAKKWKRRARLEKHMCCPSGWGHPDERGAMIQR